MKVREDTVRFSNGHEGIYGIVDKDDFVLVVPIHPDGTIQMVQQFRYPVGGRYWELPQGSWESKESVDPVQIALGELAEETGLRAKKMEPIGHFFEAYGFSNQGFHLFLATGLFQGPPERETEEHGMISGMFAMEEIVQMITEGTIKDAPTIAAIGYLRLTARI
ncbi:MAG: NUDIX hydrolase [Rhodospirillales bacterium]|nr:NUDIX hydrolase [Rhodospirillales bacterium]